MNAASFSIPCRDRSLHLPANGLPAIMGIVNMTPDSLADGGRYNTPEAGIERARRLIDEGATLIDIGGQSTRPNYTEVSVDEEIRRVIPLIENLATRSGAILSIDTYRPEVARMALDAGAHLLNDIHGLQGPDGPALASLSAASGAAVVIMHNDSSLRTLPAGDDPIAHIGQWLERSLAIADQCGLDRDRTILDPGIGFGKTQPQNLEIIARIEELHALGRPLLLGASRKSVIGYVLDKLPTDERLEGTLALSTAAALQNVQILRVHDVRANLRAARVAAALKPFRRPPWELAHCKQNPFPVSPVSPRTGKNRTRQTTGPFTA